MTVYLVGAGPGDPGLLTVRGAEVLQRADVVVYDRLSVASLLDLAPATAERISVGKAPGRPSPSQDEINALLVEHGRRDPGRTVVRLKGGDPFVFARGGEEAAALRAAGVTFEVVPGITSAIAAPAYAGIPVTLRHSSTSFTVVTGHEDPSSGEGSVDWEAVARVGGTILVLMGVERIGSITEGLLAGGLPPDTPAAAVTWGTRPEQRAWRATLATIADEPVEAPAVYVFGAVAAQELVWFEDRPLFGRRVVVTRTRQQASALAARLRELGAEPIEVPAIRIDDPERRWCRTSRRGRCARRGRLRLGGLHLAQRRRAHLRPRARRPGRSRSGRRHRTEHGGRARRATGRRRPRPGALRRREPAPKPSRTRPPEAAASCSLAPPSLETCCPTA